MCTLQITRHHVTGITTAGMNGTITYRSAEGNTLRKTPAGWYFQPKDGKNTELVDLEQKFLPPWNLYVKLANGKRISATRNLAVYDDEDYNMVPEDGR